MGEGCNPGSMLQLVPKLKMTETDIGTGGDWHVLDLHPHKPWVVFAVRGSKKSIQVWDYDEEKRVAMFSTGTPYYMAYFIVQKDWIVAEGNYKLEVFKIQDTISQSVLRLDRGSGSCILGTLAVHSTASYILGAFNKNDVALFDWDKNWEKIVFKGHSKYVTRISFHPTKLNFFGSSSTDGTIKVWDIEKRVITHTIPGDASSKIRHFQFCPKSEKPLLVAGGENGYARIWDYKAKSCIAKLEGHNGCVYSAFFHPRLPYIFTGSNGGGEVRVWNDRNYELLLSYSTELMSIYSMAPCKKSNKIVIGGKNEFLVLDVVDKQTELSMSTKVEKLQEEAQFSKAELEEKILSIQRAFDELREAQRTQAQSLSEVESMLQKEVTARQEADKACKCLTERLQKGEVERATLVEKLEKISQTVQKLEGKLKQVAEQQVVQGLHSAVGDGAIKDPPLFREYSRKELEDATENFDDKWKSGDGDPYGCCFSGKHIGHVVVRKIQSDVMTDDDPNHGRFKSNIVERLRLLHHPHLLTLMGACYADNCLVYEHAENGSVMDWISCRDRPRRGSLPWYVCLRVIAQVARALSFLHSACLPQGRGAIIHGAINPTNIMLDDKLVAKLGAVDHALIRQELHEGGEAERTAMLTFLARDSRYVAPEYWRSRALDEKTDIYAFGITALEILTGKTSNAYEMMEAVVEDDVAFQNALDSNADGWNVELARKVARLGLRCASLDSRHRPRLTTGDDSIISVLDGVSHEVELADSVEAAR